MDFHFQAIERLCCRNETQMQEEKSQEQHIRSFQMNRQSPPAYIPQHNSQNLHKQRFSFTHSSPPRLRDYREPADNRFSMKNRNYQPPRNESTNQIKLQIQKQRFGTHHLHSNKLHAFQTRCLSPTISHIVQHTPKIYFISSQKNTNVKNTQPKSPRVTFTLANRQPESKTQSKYLKAQEEETEYSSKQSQIVFRNVNVTHDSPQIPSLVTFKKHNSIFFQNKVIFQQQNQCLEYNQSVNCKQVSARYQIDNSFNNEFLDNARTIQSIMTSNEIVSKCNSRMPSNIQDKKQTLLLYTPNSSKQHIKQSFQAVRQNSLFHYGDQQNPVLSAERSASPPPSPNTSAKAEEVLLSPNAQSNLFYGSSIARKLRKSPKVSVLELNQSQENEQSNEAEELRDVIDNNYLQSQYCSQSNSPILSINQSMKNLSEEKQKKVVSVFKLSPEHSRAASNQLQLFKETRTKLKRTNTLESMGSHSSEHSCIDIKFMQRMRGRREFSHLI